MSRQLDVLFCKIAVTAGMVSPDKAQRVLAICNKRQEETGRRPLVGAVFTKYQLLTQDQVKKVNEAVARRTGGAVAAPSTVRRPRKGKGQDDGRSGGRRASMRRKKPIDQRALLTGSAFGAVFLCVIGVIVYLVSFAGDGSGDANTMTVAGARGSDGSSSSDSDKTTPEVVVPEDLSEGALQEINNRLYDINIDRSDNPARAKRAFNALKKEIAGYESRGFLIPQNVRERVKEAGKGLVEADGDSSSSDDVFKQVGGADGEDGELDDLEEEPGSAE